MVPAVPPELMLLPVWCYLIVDEMSSWTRGIVIPLAILYAHKPRWTLPESARVEELYKDPAKKTAAFDWDDRLLTWRNFFLAVDRALKLYEKLPWKPLRQRALNQARQWMLQHIERTEGLAGIYPAIMNSIFGLMVLGHSPEDPLTAREINELARFTVAEGATIRVCPRQRQERADVHSLCRPYRDAGSLDGRRHRARGGMPGAVRLACVGPHDSARREFSVERPD